MIGSEWRPSPRMVRLAPLALLATVAAAIAGAYTLSDGFRSEIGRAVGMMSQGDVDALRDYLLSFGAWAPIASLLLMVLQALVAPIPTFFVVFANGLAFGLFWGWLLSLAGQTLAAGLCFWIARALGRGPVEALIGKLGLESADGWFARRGTYGILVARLVPGIAFDAISYGAGLTRIGFWKFAAATVVGAAPQAFIYAYLGQNAPRYVWVMLAAPAFVLGGIAATALVRTWRKRAAATRPNTIPVSTPRPRAVLCHAVESPVARGSTPGGRRMG